METNFVSEVLASNQKFNQDRSQVERSLGSSWALDKAQAGGEFEVDIPNCLAKREVVNSFLATSNSFIEYQVRITRKLDGRRHTIGKRYSELREFFEELKTRQLIFTDRLFPEKHILSVLLFLPFISFLLMFGGV